jgi:hypothetical protein
VGGWVGVGGGDGVGGETFFLHALTQENGKKINRRFFK